MSKEINSIIFSGYKSFSKDTLTEIKMSPCVTVLIGKNNSGKSTCFDILESVFSPGYFNAYKSNFSKIGVSFVLDDREIETGFAKNCGGGDVPFYEMHYDYGKKFIGKKLVGDLKGSSQGNYLTLDISEINPDLELPCGADEWKSVLKYFQNYQNDYQFRRINADRDIVPEYETSDDSVEYDGKGATNILRKFINHSGYDEKLVEQLLLAELNKIMAPDSKFRNIRIQEIDVDNEVQWEIFLEELNGNRFALSKSGSGLKTIILMLINLYIIPNTKQYKDKKIIYAFEELENNLHPALQRKVFDYLYNYATENNIHIFITTHSHIAINTYFDKPNTQICHITKSDNGSQVSVVKNREERIEILEDLDVRASDLFQANGIIWVEGPSDRVYINRWLKIFCNSEFLEGSDYQFLYYGGKNLAHYTTDENLTDLINILTTNQNAVVVIDSDRRKPGSRINATKSRIKKEVCDVGGMCWITDGKEIENYIPAEVIMDKYEIDLPVIDKYTIFPEYISVCDKNFASHKVKFANEICEYITAENSKNILDLKSRVEELYEMICKWNRKAEQ